MSALSRLMLGRSSLCPELVPFIRSCRAQQWISFSTAPRVSSSTEVARNNRFIQLGQKAASFVLLGLTGAFALSALDDFAIYHNCSRKAIEKATSNPRLREALGEPIVRGQWYNASLAVAHRKHSASCTFPVVGAQGSGIIQLKAVRHGENNLFTFLGSQEWEILLLEALVHIPGNEENKHNSIQPATLQQELTQGDLDELLQNILTEETHEEMFPVPAVQSVTTETTAMADLKSFEQMGSSSQASLYSGPTLTDVKSALSQYSKQDHGSVSTLDMSTSASSTASSLLFNSLSPDDLRAHRSDSWLPTSALNMDRDIISGGTYGSFSNSINALFYKRLQKARNEPKYSLKIKSSGTTVDDGYKWRKYGQKAIKNSPHPRSYYRCTNPRCSAKKQVERSVEDPETITITYEGLHLHYSYSHIQLSQPPNYYNNNNNDHRHPHVTTEEDEEQQQHKLPENGYINIDERNTDAMQALPSFNACMEDSPTHQSQQPQEEQCVLSCSDGYNWDVFGGHIGVGEECGGGLGRGDGLLQDIVPLGIINPSSSSSSSSSSFYSSP